MSNQALTLPNRPQLEHLKKQAKDLLAKARNEDREARECFARHVRRITPESDAASFTLAEAQHALARSYGFESWPTLKKEVLARRARLLASQGLPEDREERLALVITAIEHFDAAALRALLQLDPPLAEGWGDSRPLQHAGERNAPELIDILLDAGASFEPNHGYPHHPLSWSIVSHSLEAARRLAERGAPVDFWCAAGLGDVARMRTFFDAHGRLKPGASRYGSTRYDEHRARRPIPTEPREVLSDALYIACRLGHLEAAAFLLDHGADLSFEAYAAAPALHWAAFSGHRALVTLLITRGANPQQLDGQHHADYREFSIRIPIEWSWLTALHRVLTTDPTLANEHRPTWSPPLHAAAEKGLIDHVRTLIEHGADITARDFANRTFAECAALAEDVDVRGKLVALAE